MLTMLLLLTAGVQAKATCVEEISAGGYYYCNSQHGGGATGGSSIMYKDSTLQNCEAKCNERGCYAFTYYSGPTRLSHYKNCYIYDTEQQCAGLLPTVDSSNFLGKTFQCSSSASGSSTTLAPTTCGAKETGKGRCITKISDASLVWIRRKFLEVCETCPEITETVVVEIGYAKESTKSVEASASLEASYPVFFSGSVSGSVAASVTTSLSASRSREQSLTVKPNQSVAYWQLQAQWKVDGTVQKAYVEEFKYTAARTPVPTAPTYNSECTMNVRNSDCQDGSRAFTGCRLSCALALPAYLLCVLS